MPKLTWISDKALGMHISELVGKVTSAKNEAQKKFLENVPDPFALACYAHAFNIKQPATLVKQQAMVSASQKISGAVGKFHQNILGSVRGFKNHDAGYDIESSRRKILAEIKNKHNTMNSSNEEQVISMLKHAVRSNPKYKGYLVIIIPKTPERYEKKLGKNLFKTDGSSFYDLVTGQSSALHDLFEVVNDQLCKENPEIAKSCKEYLLNGIAK